MLNNRVTREQAIAAAETLMCKHGYAHGPCIAATELVASPIPIWEIELANEGLTGPSSTTDPATIELQIAVNGDDTRFLDPWWSRQQEK